ncbi:SusD family protein [compost metagenome]
MEDLDFAIVNLRTTDLHNTINKAVAYALKARVALYEGTYRKYHTNLGLTADVNDLLTQSANASGFLIDGNQFLLNTSYETVYNSLDLSTNRQVLLYKKYITGVQGHSVVNYLTSTTVMQGPTKSAVESYTTTNGLPITQVGGNPLYAGDNGIANVRANRDGRLLKTIADFLAYNGNLVSGQASSTGYVPIKFVNRATNINGGQNDTDAPLFNYAEVLVNYAEALAELGTLTQTDLNKSVNKLRQRVGVADLKYDGVNVMSGTTGTTIINDSKRPANIPALVWEIRRERRAELMMDGFRYDDLMRWANGSNLSVSSTVNTDAFLGAKVPAATGVRINPDGYLLPYTATSARTFLSPKHYLTAIPTGQISLYAPYGGMAQNPDW